MLTGTIPEQLQLVGYVAAAMALGALIGWEREAAVKPAGIRTHMLIAGTSALLAQLGRLVVERYRAELGTDAILADPFRLFVAVIMGVSFLGAGTIIHHGRGQPEGLTTAASLLMTATIGMCVALDQWLLAIGVTVLSLLTLRGVGMLEHRYWNKPGDSNRK